jgi:hypothetical protein
LSFPSWLFWPAPLQFQKLRQSSFEKDLGKLSATPDCKRLPETDQSYI